MVSETWNAVYFGAHALGNPCPLHVKTSLHNTVNQLYLKKKKTRHSQLEFPGGSVG